MELNRDEIQKALECCSSDGCEFCPYSRMPTLANCVLFTMGNALALINELTEENESTKHKYKEFESSAKQEVAKLTAENVKLTEENERLHASCTELTQKCASLEADVAKEFTCVFGTPHKVSDCPINDEIAKAKADTVRKMQERLIAEFRKDDRMNYYIRKVLDQTAKEMLEGI